MSFWRGSILTHFWQKCQKVSKIDFFQKSRFFGFWAIFGIFCIFWDFFSEIANKSWVQFSTFFSLVIFGKNAKNGRFLGGVRGPPYSFCRFLANFWQIFAKNTGFFHVFFTFFSYPSSPGAIRPWAWRKWHFLKMPEKKCIFWKCTCCHFWPFWQILADFGSFSDLLILPPFLMCNFTGAISRSVEKTRFFFEKTRFFFAFFVIFWPFFVTFFHFFITFFTPFFAILPPFLALFLKSTWIKKGSISVYLRHFLVTFFSTFLSLFIHFFITFLTFILGIFTPFLTYFWWNKGRFLTHFLIIFWSFLIIF